MNRLQILDQEKLMLMQQLKQQIEFENSRADRSTRSSLRTSKMSMGKKCNNSGSMSKKKKVNNFVQS